MPTPPTNEQLRKKLARTEHNLAMLGIKNLTEIARSAGLADLSIDLRDRLTVCESLVLARGLELKRSEARRQTCQDQATYHCGEAEKWRARSTKLSVRVTELEEQARGGCIEIHSLITDTNLRHDPEAIHAGVVGDLGARTENPTRFHNGILTARPGPVDPTTATINKIADVWPAIFRAVASRLAAVKVGEVVSIATTASPVARPYRVLRLSEGGSTVFEMEPLPSGPGSTITEIVHVQIHFRANMATMRRSADPYTIVLSVESTAHAE